MPWKECSVMDESIRFVARLLYGEKMTALCREFAISRKTGYKIFDRNKESGLEALTDRLRRPWRYGNQLSQQWRPPSSTSNGRSPTGAHARSGPQHHPGGARSTWSSPTQRAQTQPCPGHALVSGAKAQRARVHRLQRRVPTGQQKILLPLRITPRAISSSVKPWNLPVKLLLLPPWSACLKSAACLAACARTTAFPSPRPTLCSTSPSSPSG